MLYCAVTAQGNSVRLLGVARVAGAGLCARGLRVPVLCVRVALAWPVWPVRWPAWPGCYIC